MTHFFLDSSALIKRYIVEAGTQWVRSITATDSRNTILIAHIAQVEIISGVMRRKREGTITTRTARAIRLLIDLHATKEYRVIGLAGSIVQLAEDLLEQHPLRAYDAIQLASALESNRRLVTNGLSPVIFISADSRLLMVASTVGLATEDPNAHS